MKPNEIIYLKERLKHAVRFRHKRGYGVHSPYMFHLILNVIRDKKKQFTYPEILEKTGLFNHRERKVFRLLSRLIRYLKVRKVACFGGNTDLLSIYLAQVYFEARIQSNDPTTLSTADFIYIGRHTQPTISDEAAFIDALDSKRKYMVVADIYKDPFNAHIWRLFREKATVSVDMMWYGVLFFDEKIQQGKYNLII